MSGRIRPGVRSDLAPAVGLLVLVTVVLACTTQGFLSVGNAENVGRAAAILCLAACAQAVVIATGGFDLSAGSSVALMSVVTVLAAKHGTAVGFLVGASATVAASVVTGVLVAALGIPPFIVTLGMLAALYGIAALLVGGVPVAASPGSGFAWPNDGRLLGVPVPVLIAVLALVVLGFLLRRTTLGWAWLFVGAGARAAHQAGLRTRRAIFAAYAVSGVFLALAGLVLTARVHSGDPNLDPTLAFQAIAACAVGGIPLSGGAVRPAQVAVGAIVLALVDNALNLLNLPSDAHVITVGAVIVLAVLAQRWRPARRPAAADVSVAAAP